MSKKARNDRARRRRTIQAAIGIAKYMTYSNDGPTEAAFEEAQAGGSVMTEVALRLFAAHDGVIDPVGTATVISAHLAVTARHVVDDYVSSFHGRELVSTAVDFTMSAVQELRDGRMVHWRIGQMTRLGAADLCLLHLRDPSFSDPSDPMTEWPPIPPISLLFPNPGSRVVAFGYPAGTMDGAGRTVVVRRPGTSATGKVREIFPQGRDSSLDFPAFEFDAKTVGGMSGGPVIDVHGHIAGIISRSLSPAQPGEPDISYAAALLPLLAVQIDYGRVPPTGKPEPVFDLCRTGIINAIGLNLCKVKIRGDKYRISMRRL